MREITAGVNWIAVIIGAFFHLRWDGYGTIQNCLVTRGLRVLVLLLTTTQNLQHERWRLKPLERFYCHG